MAEHVEDRDRHRLIVTCMIWKGDPLGVIQHLIHKRRPDIRPFPGLWTVVGGGLERSDYENLPQVSGGWENPLEIAVKKEVDQEAGVEIGPAKRFNDFIFIRDDDVPVYGVRYYAKYLSGTAIFDPKEATETKWITGAEIPQYEFLGNIAQELLDLEEHLRKTVY